MADMEEKRRKVMMYYEIMEICEYYEWNNCISCGLYAGLAEK